MRRTVKRAAIVGLVAFAAACSEQPAAPDVQEVTPGTQNVRPGGGESATESLINAVLKLIFLPESPNRTLANELSSTIKDFANLFEFDLSFQATEDLIELALAEGGAIEDVQELARLLTLWFSELGGFDAGFGIAIEGAEATITANSAQAGIVVEVETTTFFTIALIEGPLATDAPQSNEVYRFTASPDNVPFTLPATLGLCIDPGFVKLLPPSESQAHLIRLIAQDVVMVNGQPETKVVSLPVVDLNLPEFDDFLSCEPAVVSIEPPSGLFGLAHAGWQKLKGGIASVLSPETLHANAALATAKAYGGGKSTLTDVAGGHLVKFEIVDATNNQTGGIDSRTPLDPEVLVTDAEDNPAKGATVHWKVTSGNGSVLPLSVVTGNDGKASTGWTLGDAGTHAIEAFAHGVADPLGPAGENHEGGPFADPDAVVELGTGRLQFTAEAIISGGGELVVVNDINLFSDLADSPDNSIFIKNLVDFSNSNRPDASKIRFDFGRNSKCFDFGGCAGDELARMEEIILDVTGVESIEDHNSSSKNRIGTIPGDVKVLFLWNPTVSFGKGEIAKIGAFLADGGRVVLIGEHQRFLGANGIRAANKLLSGLGADMQVRSDNLHCGPTTITTVNINDDSDIMSGVDEIMIDCVSSMSPGLELLFSDPLFEWLAGVAIDLDADN